MIELSKSQPRPSTRLNRGNVVLANAQGVDTRLIRARLEAFREIHRRYLEEQIKVEQALALEREQAQRLANLDGEVDKALVLLSAALLADGEPRRNPFQRYAALGPGKMVLLSYKRKIAAVRELVGSLQRSSGVGESPLAAAAAAAVAATRAEEGLWGWNQRRSFLSVTRGARDSLGIQWDAAYRALRLISASVIEVPTLHTTLFPPPARTRKSDDSPTIQPPARTRKSDDSPTIQPSEGTKATVGPNLTATVTTPPSARNESDASQAPPLRRARILELPRARFSDDPPLRELPGGAAGEQDITNRRFAGTHSQSSIPRSLADEVLGTHLAAGGDGTFSRDCRAVESDRHRPF